MHPEALSLLCLISEPLGFWGDRKHGVLWVLPGQIWAGGGGAAHALLNMWKFTQWLDSVVGLIHPCGR